MRVVIAGAGPTGLTAAVELARRGVVPVVVDKKTGPSTLSRAVGILPSSLRTLGPSGVAERLLSEGIRIEGLEIFRGARSRLRIAFAGAHPERDYALALPQDRTEEALRDAFTGFGGSVRYGTALVGVRDAGEHVRVVTSDGDEMECDYVIGADGIGSATRDAVGIAYAGIDLPETWSIADVDAEEWPRPTTMTICVLPSGQFVVVVPLEPDRYRVVSNTSDALATLPLELRVTNVRRVGQFEISVRQAQSYSAGRVYLAGDAAHCHSPVGGRGMNLGIADAAELAERLVAGTLSGYRASRHAAGARVIRDSERARRFIAASGFVTGSLARFALGVARRSGALKRAVARAALAG